MQEEIKSLKLVFVFSIVSFISGFLIGATVDGMEPNLGSLSSLVSGMLLMWKIITRLCILDLLFGIFFSQPNFASI